MQRQRALYMSGEVSSLTMFFNSGDFADYLYQSEVKQRLAEQDKQLVDTLRTQIEEMNATKADIETSKQTLSAKMDELQAARGEQQDKKNQVQAEKAKQVEAKQALDSNVAELANLRSEQQAKVEYAQRQQAKAQQGISAAQEEKSSIQVTEQGKDENPLFRPWMKILRL